MGFEYNQYGSSYLNVDFCLKLNCTGLELDPADCPKYKEYNNFDAYSSDINGDNLFSGFWFLNTTILKLKHLKSQTASIYIEDSNIYQIE